MRIVLQRVSQAHVTVSGKRVGEIGQGLVILLGIGKQDQERDADYLADKVTNLRIFGDESGKMNRNILDIRGGILVVSQFTLYGDCRKGRRPGFDDAASPDEARRLYEYFVKRIETTGLAVSTGVFQASMEVTLTNDGPVTFILDSKTLK